MNKIGFKTWIANKRDPSYLDEFPDVIEILPTSESSNWLPNQLDEHAVIANAIRTRVKETPLSAARIDISHTIL